MRIAIKLNAQLLFFLGVGQKILFDTNEDINDCMYGFYYTDKSATTATIKNKPIQMNFGAISVASFVGIEDGYKTGFQICFPEINNNSADLYFRVCNSYARGFLPWKKITVMDA